MSDSFDRVHAVLDQLELVESGTDASNQLLTDLDQALDQMFQETDRTIAKSKFAFAKLEESLDDLDELCTAL